MTWPNPRRASPLALISRSALLANARLLQARDADAVADLRRDAWGHGAELAARTAARAGIRRVAVDARDRALAESLGLRVVDAAPQNGALLYGMPGTGGAPVMSLVSPVLSTKRLLAGEGVSYGYTHRAAEDTRIALVAGGYAEGVVRALGNRASVEVGGALRPIVGRVAMDVCVVDVGDGPVEAGDRAVFFGSGRVRDALARWAEVTGLSPAELVCTVGLHVEREAQDARPDDQGAAA
ncbi:alanine racemase C-terminal domain-containing protein [Microbacterium sp. NPDC096154]|uniref:alanine racemase C-terminal domain-containing protein n=1 Tax=Microbacterium sp. NPDC096154 TaxID=3155549 RepID=UPI00332E9868